MSQEAVLEGQVSIQAAMQSGSREIRTIYIRRTQRRRMPRSLIRLEQQARAADIPVVRAQDQEIEALAQGRTHGGAIAIVGPRKFACMEDLLTSPSPFIVMLDGVEDPFNFGAAVRALYSAGADGLIVRPRNWMSAAGIVARSSAGASELITTAVAQTTLDAAAFLREHGLTVACAIKADAVSIYEADLTIPLFLVIGGEKRGSTRSFLDQVDMRLRIPYRRDFRRSLGTASAVSVVAFEVMRQRMQTEPDQP
jgi:23S rRNA (guanosine2251-2'-O)-methyltransferase